MNRSIRLDRRAFLKGVGVALALPVLDAMGAEVTDQIPRRFCAISSGNDPNRRRFFATIRRVRTGMHPLRREGILSALWISPY